MIYAENISGQSITVPCITEPQSTGDYALQLYSTMNLSTADVAVASATVQGEYVVVGCDFSGLVSGEYQYTLMQGAQIISSGLLIINDYSPTVNQYNAVRTYTQYGEQ